MPSLPRRYRGPSATSAAHRARSTLVLVLVLSCVLLAACAAREPSRALARDSAPASTTASATASAPAGRAAARADRSQPPAEAEVLLFRAERALAESRLTTPAQDNALDHYLHLLVLRPGDPRARQGIDRISEIYQSMAVRSAGAGAFSDAERWLDLARQVAPAHPGLAAATQQIERLAARPVRRVALDPAALAGADVTLAERLARLGSEAKEQSLFVVIRTPRDDWGRWIYQQMNAAPPALRLRARSEIGQPPMLELSPTPP